MNNPYRTALRQALSDEFAWLDSFANPYDDHEFSSVFSDKISHITRQAGYRYVSVGRRRIRRTLIALIALMLFAVTCYAAVKAQPEETSTEPKIQWNETQNDVYGMLDITFDISGKLPPVASDPQVPEGYTVINEYEDDFTYLFECVSNNNHRVLYQRDYDISNASYGIDNENADFKEVSINGFKGYSYRKDGTNALFWTDGTDFYMLQGTCSMDVLWDMAATMKP